MTSKTLSFFHCAWYFFSSSMRASLRWVCQQNSKLVTYPFFETRGRGKRSNIFELQSVLAAVARIERSCRCRGGCHGSNAIRLFGKKRGAVKAKWIARESKIYLPRGLIQSENGISRHVTSAKLNYYTSKHDSFTFKVTQYKNRHTKPYQDRKYSHIPCRMPVNPHRIELRSRAILFNWLPPNNQKSTSRSASQHHKTRSRIDILAGFQHDSLSFRHLINSLYRLVLKRAVRPEPQSW